MKLKKFQLEEIKNVIFLFLKINHLVEFKLLFYLMMIKKNGLLLMEVKLKVQLMELGFLVHILLKLKIN